MIRFLFAAVATLSLCVTLQAQTGKHYNVALGNRDDNRKAGVNIGLGGDLDTLKGVQFNFLSSTVRKYGKGWNMGIVSAASYKQMRGLQSSSILNVVGGDMKGVQFSAIVNVAKEFKGLQLSGFNNVSISPFEGVQLCGVENISIGVSKGLQLSACMNMCINEMKGVQFSSFNYADTMNGVQVGLVNISIEQPRGVQVGIFNYSRDNNVRKIGLVNFSKQTRVQMMVFGGNSSKINLAARFRNNITYNIVGFGTHYMGLGNDFSCALYYRMGYWRQFYNDKLSFSGDIGFSHIETFQDDDPYTPERLYSLNVNLSVEYQLMSKLGLFAGVGYGMDRYYDHNRNFDKKFLFKFGVLLF